MQLRWFDAKFQEGRSRKYVAKDVLTVKNLDLPEQSFDADAFRSEFSGMSAPLQSYTKRRPDILLGIPHAYLFRPHQVVHGLGDEN